jgi:hypothetical protein
MISGWERSWAGVEAVWLDIEVEVNGYCPRISWMR